MISSSKFGKNTQLKLVSSCTDIDDQLTFFESFVSDRNLVVNTVSIVNEPVKHQNVKVLKSNDPFSKTTKFYDID